MEESIEKAKKEIADAGAETIGARKAHQAFDWRMKKSSKDEPFKRWDSDAGGRRRSKEAIKEAREKLRSARKELAERSGLAETQYQRKKRWIAAMPLEQLLHFKALQKVYRKTYLQKLRSDPVRHARELELMRARNQRNREQRSEYKRKRRAARTPEERAREAEVARAWREKHPDKVREYKRREREKKRGKGTGPA